MKKIILILLVLPMLFTMCKKDLEGKKYKTENVIIIVVDGARYSETWGDTTHQYIPYFSNQIAKFGIVNTAFYNNGKTSTISGFAALTTGVYQELNNDGLQLPLTPSIFQYFVNSRNSNWLSSKLFSSKDAWIIGSKNKLSILGNCSDSIWSNQSLPSLDFGPKEIIFGFGGYKKIKNRHDTVTLARFFDIISKHQPKLTLLAFKEPDIAGHANSWQDYLEGIQSTDEYIYSIWKFIQNDSNYSGTTALFITNDHGRHLDSIRSGFNNHGICYKKVNTSIADTLRYGRSSGFSCEGCSHINFFAFGPDFKKGIIDIERDLIDIPATVLSYYNLNLNMLKARSCMNYLNKY